MPASTKQIVFDISASAPSGAPSWVSLMTVGRWYRVSGSSPDLGLGGTNTLASVVDVSSGSTAFGVEGPSATIHGYGSAAVAPTYGTHGGYFPWDGGHAAYYGTALFAWNINTRTYARITNSFTGVPSGSWSQPSGVWSNGHPVIPHTLNAWHYHAPTNSLITFNIETSNSYNPRHQPMAYSLTTGTWRIFPLNTGQHPDAIVWAAFDAANNQYWMEGDSGAWGVSRMDFNGGDGTTATYQFFGSIGTGLQDNVVVCVPADVWDTSPVLAGVAFGANTNLRLLRTGTPTSWVNVAQSGRPSISARHSWEWSPALSALLYWNGGGNVYKITKGPGTYSAATYTWALITDAGNTRTPTYGGSVAGIFQKARLAKWGGTEVLIAHVDYNDGVYAFRVS